MLKVSICSLAVVLAMSVGYGQDMGGGMEPPPAPAATASTNAVTGTVKFDGKVKKRKPIDGIGSDAYCSTQHKTDVMPEDVIVGEGGVMANVLVYVKTNAPKDAKFPEATPTLDQKGCVYNPHVLVVFAKQKWTIKSSDNTAHNVKIAPKLNKPVDESMTKEGQTSDKTWDNKELGIAVSCQMHPWMKAVIHCLDNPFYAVTGTDGKFTLPTLPAGDYEIEAVHEKYGTKTATIKVTDKGATQDFTFKAE